MDLSQYQIILVNSSAGKDSQAMLDYIAEMAREQGVLDRVRVVHCDLGRVEWPGTKELAKEQAAHYGLPLIVTHRTQGDLLSHVRQRGRWPSSQQRYCTSDHKRGPIRRVMTALVAEKRKTDPATMNLLNCMGMRAQESPARAKKPHFEYDDKASNGRRAVWNWLPIHSWTVDQVWERIRRSGVRHHWAYDIGMPRLSCSFCIFAPKSALVLAGRHRPDLLQEYVDVERETGHTFRVDVSLVQIQNICQSEEPIEPVSDWNM